MNDDLDKLIAAEVEAAEKADADPDTPIPPWVKITRGHDHAKVLEVRLNTDEYELISKLAEEADLPLSTFVRATLLDTIRPQASQTPDDTAGQH